MGKQNKTGTYVQEEIFKYFYNRVPIEKNQSKYVFKIFYKVLFLKFLDVVKF